MTELPTTFGKYYLTEKLATGGMAEIYLAKIIGPGGFEKPLVIKQIHPELSGNRHFVDLFVAEAKTLVSLAHGNIVPVYELGVVDDTYFIAMEYIDGPTLYRLTERMAQREAHMEPALAAWITARILEGLDYAHRKGEGVIHRDLSPRNVMLSRDGEVKLVDFGIAQTLGDPGEGEDSRSAPTGSFPYMSPEQVRREALTGQTDLFSAGVLAWEMLAGRRLFARPDPDATLAAVLSEPIPLPSSVRPEVPAKLDEVVMRALARERAARWQTASDMLAQLNKYLYGLDATPGPRDLAALIARHCPPETRRQPTHVEPETLGPGEAVASGPSTAVIPRDGAARGRPQRHRTFATHVEMKEMLDRATPLLGLAAIQDPPPTESEPAANTKAAAEQKPAEQKPAEQKPPADREPERAREPATRLTDSSVDSPAKPREPEPHVTAKLARPPSRALLVLVGLGGLALAIASVFLFFAGRERVLRSERDAREADAPGVDADAGLAEADATVLAPAPFDAGVFDGGALDGGALDGGARDAGHAGRVDAGTRRSDAARPRADAAIAPPARGTATLQIGAIPWGEIYIDGKPAGRTPRELTVPAGHHTVEIVFPAETPPRKQTFAVDVESGETKPLHADFSD